MVYDDPDMDRAADMVDDLAHDLVHDGEVTPADARFACRLLEEHYKAVAEDEYGSTVACEFAWRMARQLSRIVTENPEVDWLNAYFAGTGVAFVAREESYETGLPEGPDETRHPEWHDDSGEGAAADVAQALSEFRETASLHTDLDEPLDIEWMDRAGALAMTFRHIGKRYAHDIPDDMLESYISVELNEVFFEFNEREDVTNREIVRGGRLLESWLEHRCKKEHEALCVGH